MDLALEEITIPRTFYWSARATIDEIERAGRRIFEESAIRVSGTHEENSATFVDAEILFAHRDDVFEVESECEKYLGAPDRTDIGIAGDDIDTVRKRNETTDAETDEVRSDDVTVTPADGFFAGHGGWISGEECGVAHEWMQRLVLEDIVVPIDLVEISCGEIGDWVTDRVAESTVAFLYTDVDLIWCFGLFLEVEFDSEFRKVTEWTRVGDELSGGFELAIGSRCTYFGPWIENLVLAGFWIPEIKARFDRRKEKGVRDRRAEDDDTDREGDPELQVDRFEMSGDKGKGRTHRESLLSDLKQDSITVYRAGDWPSESSGCRQSRK